MFVKDLQCWKHPLPKEVTEEGIVMLLKPEQFEKQKSPKEVTEEGIVMFVKPEQPSYLEVTDYQLFMVNTVEKWIGFYL